MATQPRHIISLRDLTEADLESIVRRGVAVGRDPDRAGQPLRGKILATYFSKPSTRTRTSFTSAALRLGAQVIPYAPGDLQLNTGETHGDTGRVLSRMVDGLVVRTAGPPAEMRALADGGLSLVNAMSADEHPTQALADLTTITARFGSVKGLRFLYVGEGNNTAAALALSLPRYPQVAVEFRTPPGYGLAGEVLAEASALAERTGSHVIERHDMDRLPVGVDVVYTTRWQTTGTSKPDPEWRRVFAPFQVTPEVMDRHPDAVFMHDLPAHRGEEVTTQVLDGPASIAFDQAAYKLYSAMAVLEWCMADQSHPRH